MPRLTQIRAREGRANSQQLSELDLCPFIIKSFDGGALNQKTLRKNIKNERTHPIRVSPLIHNKATSKNSSPETRKFYLPKNM